MRPRISRLSTLTGIALALSMSAPAVAQAQESPSTETPTPPAALPTTPEVPAVPTVPAVPSLPAAPGEQAPGAQPPADQQTQQPPAQTAPTSPFNTVPFPTNAQISQPKFQTRAGAAAGQTVPEGFRANLSASGEEKWTDNVYLSADNQKSDFVTTVTPTVNLSEKTRKIDGGLNYGVSYDQYADNSKVSGFRHNGLGVLTTELIDQTFFLDMRGSISEQATNPYQPTAADNRVSPTNTSLVQTYSITPRLQQRLGSWAVGQVAYTHDQTFSTSDTSGGTTTTDSQTLASANSATDDSGKVQLHSGEDFSTLLWDYSTEIKRHTAGDSTGGTSRQVSHTLQTEYRLSQSWGLLAQGGYDDMSGRYVDSSKFSGAFYQGGVHWTPSPNLDLRVGLGRRYDASSVYAQGQYYIGPRTIVRVSQQTGVSSGSQSFADALNAVQRNDAGQFVNPFTGLAANPSTQMFGASSATYRQKTTSAMISHSGDRDALTLTLQYAEQEPTSSTPVTITTPYGTVLSGNSTTGSVTGQWTHQLTPVLSGIMMASVSDVLTANQTTSKATTARGNVSLNYQLNPTLTGSLSFYHQQSWQQLTDEIREETVTVGLHKAF